MGTINLLYRKQYAISDSINIMIPTVGEIIEKEDDYYGLVSVLTAMPIDLMVQLDDAGIDFTTISDYELFLLMFTGIKNDDTSLIFGDLDLSKFEIAANEQNNALVLLDREHDIVIDYMVYQRIAATLRRIHHLEKNFQKPGNEEAKRYLLDRARKKLKRQSRRPKESPLESLIITMVNTEQYKYNYETTKDLTIYQFNESVQQIIKKVDYDNRMHGVYAGTIDIKSLSRDEMIWLKESK